MTAKEFLSQYVTQEQRISSKEEKVMEFKMRSQGLSRVLGEKVQTSKQIRGTEKMICIYADLQKELLDEVKELKVKLHLIKKAISKIQDLDQKQILELKYIIGLSFFDISDKIHMSERQVFRVHGKALEKIQEIIDKY